MRTTQQLFEGVRIDQIWRHKDPEHPWVAIKRLYRDTTEEIEAPELVIYQLHRPDRLIGARVEGQPRTVSIRVENLHRAYTLAPESRVQPGDRAAAATGLCAAGTTRPQIGPESRGPHAGSPARATRESGTRAVWP